MTEIRDKEHLILKSFSGKLEKDEQLLLDSWMAESEENKLEYKSYRELWNKSKELVLSDTIDVEAALTKTKSRLSFSRGKKRWLIIARQVAAVLLISFALASLYHYFGSNGNNQPIYQDVSTGHGMHTSLTLADGTKVWLNSDSHLRFPLSFNNLDMRKVQLEGEAFFKVASNKDFPFVVSTGDLDIKVLGTSFNVSAYADYNEMTVALEEGKISLLEPGVSENKVLTMKPNQVATFNRESRKLRLAEEKELEKYSAWREGRLTFFGDNIQTVEQKMEKWYNVDIVIADDEIRQYHFTATFTDETLNQALSLLCSSSGLTYEIVGAERQPDGEYTRRKVILSAEKDQ